MFNGCAYIVMLPSTAGQSPSANLTSVSFAFVYMQQMMERLAMAITAAINASSFPREYIFDLTTALPVQFLRTLSLRTRKAVMHPRFLSIPAFFGHL